jgi:mannose-6-phosphate isomerase
MPAERLATIRVEKPWGRHTLWPGFPDAPDAPVGEIWFQAPPESDPELLIKYLFTSERLSIQVHPNDEVAHAAGCKRGKDEAWIILAAEPDATIALGLKRPVSRAVLRDAALDGTIADLVDWKPVKAGDVIYSPAGTVHAIGAGLTLIEVQQSLDLTYRLFDYGRPRELHLDAGLAVADLVPFVAQTGARRLSAVRDVIVAGGTFVVERIGAGAHQLALPEASVAWLIPVRGGGAVAGQAFAAGECWLLTGACALAIAEGADVLLAYPGAAPHGVLFN